MKLIFYALLFCLAGLLVFFLYTPALIPEQSYSFNGVDYFKYGNRYRSLNLPDKPSTNKSSVTTYPVLSRVKTFTKKELATFKGLLDLPKASFTYMLVRLEPSMVERMMYAGLILMKHHPKKARRYADCLLKCQVVQQNTVDEETSSVESERTLDLPIPGSTKDIAPLGNIAETLSVSAWSLLNWFSWGKLFDFIWCVLVSLYYITTVIGCLLVVFFVRDQIVNYPLATSVRDTLPSWPPSLNKSPSTLFEAPSKSYPYSIPL